jgi:hypothetical protein
MHEPCQSYCALTAQGKEQPTSAAVRDLVNALRLYPKVESAYSSTKGRVGVFFLHDPTTQVGHVGTHPHRPDVKFLCRLFAAPAAADRDTQLLSTEASERAAMNLLWLQ